MHTINKISALRSLVKERRQEKAGSIASGYSKNYSKLGDFHDGIYDFDDYIVPYSKSAFNLDAKIMIILQDWASEEFLKKGVNQTQVKFGHDPNLSTNKNLFYLLKKYFNITFAETYATDVFPFIKPGNMSTGIPMKDMMRAAEQFAIPQIKIISPKIVICLGNLTFNSIRRAFGLKGRLALTTPLDKLSFSIDKSLIVGSIHVGAEGTRAIGGKAALENNWEKLSMFYNSI